MGRRSRLDPPPLIEVSDLHVRFRVGDGTVEAVKGASPSMWPADTLVPVGESGSGKTAISRAIMRILPKAAEVTSGRILFHGPHKRDGTPVDIVSRREMRVIRGGLISVIFQEPMTSLSPLHTVGDQVSEALHLHRSRRGASSVTCFPVSPAISLPRRAFPFPA